MQEIRIYTSKGGKKFITIDENKFAVSLLNLLANANPDKWSFNNMLSQALLDATQTPLPAVYKIEFVNFDCPEFRRPDEQVQDRNTPTD